MHRKITPIQTNTVVVSAPERLLVDVHAAADMISSPVSTIRRLIRQKQLQYILLGKKFLLDPNDLRNLITKNKINGAA
jgi:hypothetical protein